MKLFGEFLVEEGFVTLTQLNDGIRCQEALRRQPIGELLVDLKILTRQTLDECLPRYFASLGRDRGRLIGEFLVEERLISSSQLEESLREQRRRRTLRIGEVLVTAGHLTRAALDRAVQQRFGDLGVRAER